MVLKKNGFLISHIAGMSQLRSELSIYRRVSRIRFGVLSMGQQSFQNAWKCECSDDSQTATSIPLKHFHREAVLVHCVETL